MDEKEVRWKQRFENFDRAFRRFESVSDVSKLNELESEGCIHRFEYCFELTWKIMKDCLENQGSLAKTPKEAIKEAFQADILYETTFRQLGKSH